MNDLEYIRRVGEDVREALFPRPRADGARPFPTPVAVEYAYENGTTKIVRFVSNRTFHWVDSAPREADATLVCVIWEGYSPFYADLTFNKEPALTGPVLPADEAQALHNLLHAITGTLTDARAAAAR